MVVEDLGGIMVFKGPAEVHAGRSGGKHECEERSPCYIREHAHFLGRRTHHGEDGGHDAEENLGCCHAIFDILARAVQDTLDDRLCQHSVGSTPTENVTFDGRCVASKVLSVLGHAVLLLKSFEYVAMLGVPFAKLVHVGASPRCDGFEVYEEEEKDTPRRCGESTHCTVLDVDVLLMTVVTRSWLT